MNTGLKPVAYLGFLQGEHPSTTYLIQMPQFSRVYPLNVEYDVSFS